MSTATVRGVVRRLGLAEADPESDAALLIRYTRQTDHDAFAELLRRHGPVVFGACRRVLNDLHDAEDAFQATFLVLAVKASSVRPPGSVGGWLYGVAVNVARKAKVTAARRWRREMATVMANQGREATDDNADRGDLRAVIDEELGRLPNILRDALVLCDLNERTRSEAARELGCPEGTIAARLHRARKMLGERLTRRGVSLPAAGITVLLAPEIVSAALTQSTLAATASFVSNAASTLVSPAARTLAEGVMRISTGKLKLSFAALAVCLLTGGGLLWGADRVEDSTPTAATTVTPEVQALAADPPAKADPIPGYVTEIRFSPGGKLMAVVAGGKVTVSVTDFKPQHTGFGPVLMTMPGEAVAFSPDGTTLFVVGPKEVTSHDILTRVAKSYPRPKTNLGWHQVAFTPDGKRYAAHFGSYVRIYDTATGFEPMRFDNQHEPGSSAFPATVGQQIAFSPDGKRFAAVGVLVDEGKTGAAVWDAETGKRLKAFEADFTDGPKSIAFSPDGKQIAVAFAHKAVLYDAATLKELRQVHTIGTVSVVAFTPNGLVALGGEAKLSDGKQPPTDVRRIVVHIDDARKDYGSSAVLDYGNEVGKTTLPLNAMAFSPDGKILAMGTGYPSMTSLPANAPKIDAAVRVFPLDGSCGPGAALDGWKPIKAIAEHDDYVDGVAFGPDGQTFATAGGGTVIMWDAATQKKLWTYKVGTPGISAIAYSPNGLQLAVTHKDGATLLNAVSGQVERQVEEKDSNPSAIAFAPAVAEKELKPRQLAFTNGRALWAKSWIPDNGPISTAQMGPMAGTVAATEFAPAAISWSPTGDQLVFIPNAKIDPAWFTSTNTGRPDPKKATHYYAMVWGAGSGKPMSPILLGTDPVSAVAWSPDGKIIAVGDSTGDIALFDAKTSKELRRMHVGGRNGKSFIHSLLFSPDGKAIAAALQFEDGKNVNRVVLFETATGKRGQDLQFFWKAPPVSIAFAPDGRTLLVGCGHKEPFYRDKPAKERVGEVQIWSLDTDGPNKPANPEAKDGPDEVFVLPHHAGPVDSVAFAPDGKSFVSGGADGKVFLWDTATRKPQELGMLVPAGKHTAVAFSPDGKLIAATRDKVTGFFDPAKRQTVLMNPPFPGGRGVAFSPDGKWVATSNGFRTSFRAFNPLDGEAGGASPGELEGQLAAPVVWSPDSNYIAFLLPSAEPNGDWRIGMMGVGPDSKPRNLEGHKGKVLAVAWSKDGKMLASGGTDAVVLWDTATWKELRRVTLGGPVNTLAFAPDGATIAAGVERMEGREIHRIVTIDVATGKELDFVAVGAKVRSVAFSPDGKSVLAAYGIDRSALKPTPTPKETEAAGGVVLWNRHTR